jgi:hypothetical protein
MSRTKKRGGSTSPVKKYITFSGSTGTFKYWDKNLGAKGENVELKDLEIIVLDTRASITGFNESLGAGISSNMIADTTKEVLKVVSFANGKPNSLAEGLYQDIKPELTGMGGKFTTNVICLADVGDGVEVVNLQLSGVALGSWIEFAAEHPNDAFYDFKITVKKGVLSKRLKGKTIPVTAKEEKELDAKIKKNPRTKQPIWFYVLDFDVADLTEEEAELAVEEDDKLQAYFEVLTGVVSERTDSTVSSDPDAPEDEEEEDKDDLPF